MMAKGVVAGAVALLAAFAVLTQAIEPNANDVFVLVFTGQCDFTSNVSYTCKLSANSQAVTTLINAQDAVDFTYSSTFGTYASIECKGMISHHGKRVNETGTISFGSHLARDHTLDYASFGDSLYSVNLTDSGSKDFVSAAAHITNGTGNFEGAKGAFGYTSYILDDQSRAVWLVTALSSINL